MTRIRKLAGDTLLYGLGNIIPRSLNFILFPIHAKFRFNPEEFGVFTWLMSLVAFLNILYSFGMETTYFRYATKPGADKTRVFNAAMTFVLASGILFTTLIIGFSDQIAVTLDSWIGGRETLTNGIKDHPDFIVWLAIIMFVDSISAIPFARLRLESRPLRFAFYRISNVLVVIALNLYFLFVVYDPKVGIGYIFLAMLIANSMYLVFFARTFLSWRPVFDREISSSMLSYSYPIVMTGLLGTANEFFSRILLGKWLPEGFYAGRTSAFAVGVFGASYRLAVIMNLAVMAFRMAAEPFFFSNAADKESPKLFAKINHYFTVVCCFILLGVAINLDILKHLMAKEYWEAVPVVVPLLLGYMFFGIYYNMTVWYKLTDKTIYGTYITIGGVALTIGLNYIFIPIAGYLGSAWISAFVFLVMTVVCYLLGQKYYPIPYRLLSDGMYILTTIGLVYAVNSYQFTNLYAAAAVHLLVLAAWFGIVYLIEGKKLRSNDA